LLTVSALSVAEEVYPFDNDRDRERFQRFTYEMRCPLCQSQNLAGSDSMISQDLKRELHRLVSEGKTDAEIIDFMSSRYGDFVLYRPRVEGTNLILWLSPIVLILFGLGAFLTIVIKKQPPADEE
jgi:cytochrome c-type biogenesis protein CcmH